MHHITLSGEWVLDPASKPPWRLCRGDVAANIQEIADMENLPEKPVSKRIWELTQEDFPHAQLKLAVELLGECAWSSLPTEQHHASVSLLHRWHPEYGMQQLLPRA